MKIERLAGPKTHVCWTPDATPAPRRQQVSLVRERDLHALEQLQVDQSLVAAARRVANSIDDCTHDECQDDRAKTGYACCAGGHIARGAVRAILGTDEIPGGRHG